MTLIVLALVAWAVIARLAGKGQLTAREVAAVPDR